MVDKLLLTAFGIVAAITCVFFFLAPEFSLERFDGRVDGQTTILVRLAGALFAGLALIAWAGRAASACSLRTATMLGLGVANGLAAIAALSGATADAYNQFAWAPTLVFSAFGVGFLAATLAQIRTAASGAA